MGLCGRSGWQWGTFSRVLVLALVLVGGVPLLPGVPFINFNPSGIDLVRGRPGIIYGYGT